MRPQKRFFIPLGFIWEEVEKKIPAVSEMWGLTSRWGGLWGTPWPGPGEDSSKKKLTFTWNNE